MLQKPVILSGMRPSGRLHFGNYVGALKNWIRLQDDYHCYYCIADWHALTTDYNESEKLQENIREMLLDWLSAGLDPARVVIFRQSAILEQAELFLLLAMITPIAWLERCPTFKEQLRQLEGKEINTYGFLGYPLLQAADILAYRADAVPVGEDQSPHIEIAREVARRFNYLYSPVFAEPQALFSETTLVPGLDGRKMSKSYGNYIALSTEPDRLKQSVHTMVTDPARVRRKDPGHPEVCTVFAFHRIFNPGDLTEIEAECRQAGIGCVRCKERLTACLVEHFAPFFARRQELLRHPGRLDEILEDGNNRARQTARATLEKVREGMGL